MEQMGRWPRRQVPESLQGRVRKSCSLATTHQSQAPDLVPPLEWHRLALRQSWQQRERSVFPVP